MGADRASFIIWPSPSALHLHPEYIYDQAIPRPLSRTRPAFTFLLLLLIVIIQQACDGQQQPNSSDCSEHVKARSNCRTRRARLRQSPGDSDPAPLLRHRNTFEHLMLRFWPNSDRLDTKRAAGRNRLPEPPADLSRSRLSEPHTIGGRALQRQIGCRPAPIAGD